MEHHRSGGCPGDQRIVDLENFKFPQTPAAFFFESHTDPDIRVKNVRLIRPSYRISGHEDSIVRQPPEQRIGRAIVFGGRNSKLKSQSFGGPNPGMGDVVIAIADEADL